MARLLRMAVVTTATTAAAAAAAAAVIPMMFTKSHFTATFLFDVCVIRAIR